MTNVEKVEVMLLKLEEKKGARCPIRSVPIDMVTEAAERESQSTGVTLELGLWAVLSRYCETYTPPHSEATDIFGVALPYVM